MNTERVFVDPTGELSSAKRERLERPASLKGLTVGLLDISKAKGDIFLDHIALKLEGMGAKVERYAKPTFTRVAPMDLKQLISTQCDVVIEALAD
ncbi:MAG: hypothetical protein COA73_07075 [Candidatus Hydrogenedentota bacterium]|nr:MAG: hypothetical protein COA73_07075 [Candidatus Hydrogenedentota bacterium]